MCFGWQWQATYEVLLRAEIRSTSFGVNPSDPRRKPWSRSALLITKEEIPLWEGPRVDGHDPKHPLLQDALNLYAASPRLPQVRSGSRGRGGKRESSGNPMAVVLAPVFALAVVAPDLQEIPAAIAEGLFLPVLPLKMYFSSCSSPFYPLCFLAKGWAVPTQNLAWKIFNFSCRKGRIKVLFEGKLKKRLLRRRETYFIRPLLEFLAATPRGEGSMKQIPLFVKRFSLVDKGFWCTLMV